MGVKAPGLVGEYKFEGNGNDTSCAASGNGTVTNATYTTGYFGQGLTLNGTNAWVNFGDIFDFIATFSIFAKIKTDAANGIIASRDNIGANRQYIFSVGGTGVLAFYDGTTSFAGSGALTDDVWYRVRVVINGASSQLYVDGAANGSAFDPAGLANEIVDFAIGSDNNGDANLFDGELDEILIYDRAVPEGEGRQIDMGFLQGGM